MDAMTKDLYSSDTVTGGTSFVWMQGDHWHDIQSLRILAIYEAKKQQNLQILDNLACNSANKPSFQNLTKSLYL